MYLPGTRIVFKDKIKAETKAEIKFKVKVKIVTDVKAQPEKLTNHQINKSTNKQLSKSANQANPQIKQINNLSIPAVDIIDIFQRDGIVGDAGIGRDNI